MPPFLEEEGRRYFGNLPLSMLSLFMSNWPAMRLAQEILVECSSKNIGSHRYRVGSQRFKLETAEALLVVSAGKKLSFP